MTRKAFCGVICMIQNSAVFQTTNETNNRGRRQYPVEYQMMTFLHYLSSPGINGSGEHIRNHFHVDYGSKDLYVRRCIKAIRECMRGQYYCWPNATERQQLACEYRRNYELPNCILVMDGTTFKLSRKPKREDAADYSGRKDGYTITNLFFSDIKRRVRYYTAGWAGSTHDNRLWTNCKLYKQPSRFFSHNEYVLGDSAFQDAAHMVTTYKTPTGGTLHGSRQRFNKLVSSARVISEHVNGILKGRFPWLSAIPNEINEDPISMRRIVEIIDVCVILHNFLIEHNLNYDDNYFYTPVEQNDIDNEEYEPLVPEDELNQPINVNADRGICREQLRAYLSEKGII